MRHQLNQANTIYFFLITFFLLSSCRQPESLTLSRSETLSGNWKMQPVDRLKGIDDQLISVNNFDTKDWYEAVVPGTVLGSLATKKVIEDPTFGINMKNVDTMQFKQPWWYRTTFKLNGTDLKKNISLRFNGINYRADMWINGKKVAGKELFAGTYRMYSFNINAFVLDGENTLALKLSQFADGEYSLGFCDWNPLPSDRSMGIFRDVFLDVNDGIKIRSPFVYSKVDTATKNRPIYIFRLKL